MIASFLLSDKFMIMCHPKMWAEPRWIYILYVKTLLFQNLTENADSSLFHNNDAQSQSQAKDLKPRTWGPMQNKLIWLN